MDDREREARRRAHVHTGCQGGFEQGWDAGAAFERVRNDEGSALITQGIERVARWLLDEDAASIIRSTKTVHETQERLSARLIELLDTPSHPVHQPPTEGTGQY